MVEDTMLRKYRKIDFIAILMLAILWGFATFFINRLFHQFGTIISLFITAIFITFIALIINKFGAVALFYTIGTIMTIRIDNLYGFDTYKVPIFAIAGIIFELSFLLLKMKVSNIPIDVILGAAFSNFSIPFIMFLFVLDIKGVMPYIWNFALMSFLVGIIGSIIAFLIWYNIRGLKPIIKFEYSV